MKLRTRIILKNAFKTGITLKGIDGVLETIGGLLLWLIHPSAMNAIVRVLTQHELSHDPRDFIAVHLLGASTTLLSARIPHSSSRRFSHAGEGPILIPVIASAA